MTSRGWGLFWLAAACFVSVTAENLPVAVNPQMAAGLHVSSADVGYLVTGYAVVVALSAVPLVRVAARWDRRTTAVVTIAAVALANAALAVAPDYPLAAAARLIAALGHGVFWSTVAPTAARLVAAGQERSGDDGAGRATGTVFLGNSAAFVAGLPLSSGLGAALGWRPVAAALALAAAVIAIGVRRSLPAMPPPAGSAAGRAAEEPATPPGLRGNRALWWVIASTLLLILGHFTPWTYISLLITRYAHLHGTAVSWVLLANGAVGLAGLAALRPRVDTAPRTTGLLVAGGLAASMVLLVTFGAAVPAVAVVALVAWALPGASIALVLQVAVIRAAPRDQDRASALYVVVFQIGIAGGAAVGGWLLDRSALPATTLVAVACGLAVVVIMLRTGAFGRRASGDSASAHPASTDR